MSLCFRNYRVRVWIWNMTLGLPVERILFLLQTLSKISKPPKQKCRKDSESLDLGHGTWIACITELPPPTDVVKISPFLSQGLLHC